jgi:hypothetical protein
MPAGHEAIDRTSVEAGVGKPPKNEPAGQPRAAVFGYGDLVARRCWQKIILRRLVRAGAADDGGPGSAGVAEGMIEE